MNVVGSILGGRILARVANKSAALNPQRLMSTLDEQFKISQEKLKEIPEASTAEKLQMYSLFKQATEGKNTKKKPSAIDFEGSAKWKAWSKLGDLPQEDAKQKYVELVNDLLVKAGKEPVVA